MREVDELHGVLLLAGRAAAPISTNASGMTKADTSTSVLAGRLSTQLVIQIADIGKRFSRRCMRSQLEELYWRRRQAG